MEEAILSRWMEGDPYQRVLFLVWQHTLCLLSPLRASSRLIGKTSKEFLLNGIDNEFKNQFLHRRMSAFPYRLEVWQSYA